MPDTTTCKHTRVHFTQEMCPTDSGLPYKTYIPVNPKAYCDDCGADLTNDLVYRRDMT